MSRFPHLHNYCSLPNARSPRDRSLPDVDNVPEITNILIETMASPTTPAHTADTTTCPNTPVRVAAAALAVPTSPVATTTSAENVFPDAVTPHTPRQTKQVRVQVAYNSPADDLVPLIIAANDVKFNYKAMAAMDPHNRTASALEHKVRNFRQAARALVAAAKEKKDEADSDADGQSGKGLHDKEKSTPARKEPVKASPRGRKAETAKDSEPDAQQDGTPSKKPKVPRKRQVKIEDTDEHAPVKKRKTTKKNQVRADEEELPSDG